LIYKTNHYEPYCTISTFFKVIRSCKKAGEVSGLTTNEKLFIERVAAA